MNTSVDIRTLYLCLFHMSIRKGIIEGYSNIDLSQNDSLVWEHEIGKTESSEDPDEVDQDAELGEMFHRLNATHRVLMWIYLFIYFNSVQK